MEDVIILIIFFSFFDKMKKFGVKFQKKSKKLERKKNSKKKFQKKKFRKKNFKKKKSKKFCRKNNLYLGKIL